MATPTATKLIESCSEFLAQNLTVDVAEDSASVYEERDACGNPIYNATYVSNHSSKYAVIVFYPIFLAVCTIGNTLTVLILYREQQKTVKRIYLLSLAYSDVGCMWSQFPLFLANFDLIQACEPFMVFINSVFGGCAFLREMFIMASDWILIAFSLERFFAVTFPLHYGVLISKKRAIFAVVIIFVLAALNNLFNLVDYYWFYYNDDPRCPAMLIHPPMFFIRWHDANEWVGSLTPMITFLTIFSVNLAVCIQLLNQRKFRNIHTRSSVSDKSENSQVIKMLLASVAVYVCTQFLSFVSNIIRLSMRSPICSGMIISDDTRAICDNLINVAVSVNYSVNFFLYCAASESFRDGFLELTGKKVKQPLLAWSSTWRQRELNASNERTRIAATTNFKRQISLESAMTSRITLSGESSSETMS